MSPQRLQNPPIQNLRNREPQGQDAKRHLRNALRLSSLFFPILMHSLGDVWHPGPGVPCFGGFGGFCSLWGLTVSLSSLFFPIFMHSLGDVWHPGPGVPCFGGFGGFCSLWGLTVSLSSLFLQPLEAHSLTFFPILPYLNAFLRWRLASWPWGSLFRRFWRVLQPLGAHSLTFFPILPYLNAFLRWRLASWPWGFPVSEVFGGFLQPLGGSQSHFLPYSSLS